MVPCWLVPFLASGCLVTLNRGPLLQQHLLGEVCRLAGEGSYAQVAWVFLTWNPTAAGSRL